ncbi:hypothetical protein Aph01nite_16320 [Acrocarpospora phusangensis]|uniref:Uncharacterized protein n=1 Tax=Acrocarpospora phusangensis TaxID=1070424 RepID=A0A919QBJ2_9ACTN|nr:hypothetical protein [Acrocarpospora phusangensis]GIH23322.1 hypothetical protein Aph01nite_16320 [Acrocarpospora phusangensis]
MADEQITTIGRCYLCKRTFGFAPGSVMTVLMDPETNLPLGMTLSGGQREPTPEAAARSVEEHVCPDCVGRVKQLKEFMDSPVPPFKTWQRP